MLKQRIVYLFIFVSSAILIFILLKSFENEKPKVVVVLKELKNNQYWDIIKAGAEEGFRDFNIDGKVIAPSNEYDIAEQEKILRDVLKESPDVLIVSPIKSSEISILKEFDKHNIPVLLIDSNMQWENKTSYIGTDNLKLGLTGGALLASDLQPGDKVALITGEGKDTVLHDRIKGAKTSLKDAGINIVTHEKIKNNDKQAKMAMEKILTEHADIKGVYATTDILALSAIEFIEENEFNISVIGVDGVTEMLKLIEEGSLPSAVTQNPYDMGYLSIEAASKVVNGEYIKRNINSGVDIITQDNATGRLDFTRRVIEIK